MPEYNGIIVYILLSIIAIVVLSTFISLFFYFLEGYKSGWKFRERLKVMNTVLEEKYKSERTNVYDFIFFFVHFKLGWTIFLLFIVFLLIGAVIIENYSSFV